MLRLLSPDVYLKSIYELDIARLRRKGIKGIITDLDNTLVAWDDDTIYPALEEWFARLREEGFQVCILSNSFNERVRKFSEKFAIPAIPRAAKPRRKAYRRALEKLRLDYREVAVLGDQVFTDVLGGNRMGLFTILVIPVSKQEFVGTKVVRKAERVVLKTLHRRGMLPRGSP